MCSDSLTIDEQLMPFRGRSQFIQYNPQKTSKYGINIFWLCDFKFRYAANGDIYTGKEPRMPVKKDLAKNVVMKLTDYIHNSGRNITMDNYFTSVPLAEDLLKKRLTIVGTIRNNKREIPSIMKPNKSRSVCSSEFGFTKNMTMVSYVPKEK